MNLKSSITTKVLQVLNRKIIIEEFRTGFFYAHNSFHSETEQLSNRTTNIVLNLDAFMTHHSNGALEFAKNKSTVRILF